MVLVRTARLQVVACAVRVTSMGSCGRGLGRVVHRRGHHLADLLLISHRGRTHIGEDEAALSRLVHIDLQALLLFLGLFIINKIMKPRN